MVGFLEKCDFDGDEKIDEWEFEKAITSHFGDQAFSRQEIFDEFDKLDRNYSGKISKYELEEALKNTKELKKNSGWVSLEETPFKDRLDDLMKIVFREDWDSSKIIEANEFFCAVQKEFGSEYSLDEINQLFGLLDSNGNGWISMHEFEKAIKKTKRKTDRKSNKYKLEDAIFDPEGPFHGRMDDFIYFIQKQDWDNDGQVNEHEFKDAIEDYFGKDEFSNEQIWYLFDNLDKNRTGWISQYEFEKVLKSYKEKQDENAKYTIDILKDLTNSFDPEGLIEYMDLNNDGVIEFREFERGMMDLCGEDHFKRSEIEDAFKKLDANGTGEISQYELEKAIYVTKKKKEQAKRG